MDVNITVSVVSLLSKVSYNSKTDHLILTGDLISKGPHSPAVVDLALSLNASCVRGNHEDRVLLAHHDMHKLHLSSPGPREDMKLSGAQDTLEEERFSHRDYTDRQLAKSLSQRQIDYLAACPVILRVGEIRGMGEVSVVHAGLIPGVDLKNQDPLAAMTMRTVDLHTHVPSSIADGVPWSKVCSTSLHPMKKIYVRVVTKLNHVTAALEQVSILPTPTPALHRHLRPRFPPRSFTEQILQGH